MIKGQKLYSIFKGRCPKCHEGDMYENKNPFVFGETLKMKERCEVCGLKYKIEPSFFYGAMYVSYALGVALGVAVFITAHFILSLSILKAFWTIVLALLLLYPILMRMARNIWINIFVHYNPPPTQKENDKD